MYDVLIVGGGPAGLTAGLYCARAGLCAVLLESGFAGGQAATTDQLMNYPGFPEGIGGPELMMAFADQAERAGLEIRYAEAESLSLAGEVKTAHTAEGDIEAKCVILAMGAHPRPLGVPGEAALTGRGISYCATCDGALYRGKPVAVVGGGDTAVEDALYLARFSPVTLIHRRDTLRARGLRADTVMDNAQIEKRMNAVVTAAEKEGEELVLTLKATDTGEESTLRVAACFAAVGLAPNTALVKEQLDMTEDGRIVAGEDTHTSIPGVFAAGDLRTKPLRQVICAASDGAVAATEAAQYLFK